jgi:hypothetical protein
MKHPEVLSFPFLMLADYYLTLIGAVQQEKKYSEHFKSEQYELNPVWQTAVARRQWFNPKHLVLTVCISSAIIFLVEFGKLPDRIADGAIGCALVLFTMLLARHVNNLVIFRYMIRHPDHITGQVTMRYVMTLWLSLFQYCAATVPLVLIAALSANAFAVGGCIAGLLLLGCHVRWIEMARVRKM